MSDDENQLTQEQIEAAAILSAENMGAPTDLYYPELGVWLIRDGKLTEEGIKFWERLERTVEK